jgi:hypothetical protein
MKVSMTMNRKSAPSLVTALGLITILFILHLVALKLHLYYTTWWMDIINHFLGGMIAAILGLHLFGIVRKDSKNYFWLLLVFVLLVGLIWEIFELSFGLTFVSAENYWGDTIGDIIMDMVGMLALSWHLISK